MICDGLEKEVQYDGCTQSDRICVVTRYLWLYACFIIACDTY